MRKINKGPIILLDVGGVLVEFTGACELKRMLGDKLSEQEIVQRWNLSPLVNAHETGKISTIDFCNRFVLDWQLPLSGKLFLQSFRCWVKRPSDVFLQHMATLVSRYRCITVSNTNELHFSIVMEQFGLGSIFSEHVSSFIIGYRKPDSRMYAAARSKAGLVDENLLFFDDSRENVDGARATGIESHVVNGVIDLMRTFKKIKLL